MRKKLRVGIIFGGKSAEHEVSLQSAKSVIDALDKAKYEPVLIGIDKKGGWHLQDSSRYLLNANNPKLVKLNKSSTSVQITPGQNQQIVPSHRAQPGGLDVVFPVLHGTFGEDGTMQGLLELLDLPFVGPGVLGSAIGMDKDVMKRLLRAAGLPVAKFLTIRRGDPIDYRKITKVLGSPVFVKPANLGSSVGISKAKNKKGFDRAVKDAFLYDHKILIEQSIVGREIEVSVLGNDNPKASLPGEIIPKREFYSYEAKYIDEDGAKLVAPVKLPANIVKKIQTTAVEAFKTLELEGMARVDMFLAKNNKVIINELNTIPGFTKISMYPKLWDVSGLPYPKLLDRLIQLAMERHQKEKKLKRTFS